MSPSHRWRFGLLAIVAVVFALPLYIDYLHTLLRLLLWLLGVGLLTWGVIAPRKGSLRAQGVVAAPSERGLAKLFAHGVVALAGVIRAFVQGLLSILFFQWRAILTTLVLCTALVFILGYQVPQADAYPHWPEFPQLQTAHLVVEFIPDFDVRYGRRYHLPETFGYGGVDSPRVTAVRALGHWVQGNTFQVAEARHYTNSGRFTPYPSAGQGFSQFGDNYLEINLAGEKGYCKNSYYSYRPPLFYVYQYNQPTTRQDTLLLRVDTQDYRIFIR
jgi:hypothetical protein